MTTSFLKQHIGDQTLSETVAEQASQVGHSFKPGAEFDALTESEQEKLNKQSFPDSLVFSVDVNLTDSKKAFLNFMKGFDDPSEVLYEQLWKLQPHNPLTYDGPGIGRIHLNSIHI